MERPWKSLNKLNRFAVLIIMGRRRYLPFHIHLGSYPATESIPAISNNILRRFTIRHATGKIRKHNHIPPTVILGKWRYDMAVSLERILRRYWFDILYIHGVLSLIASIIAMNRLT
jgi:hypothetical protein